MSVTESEETVISLYLYYLKKLTNLTVAFKLCIFISKQGYTGLIIIIN